MKSLMYAIVYVAALIGAEHANFHLPQGDLEAEALLLSLH